MKTEALTALGLLLALAGCDTPDQIVALHFCGRVPRPPGEPATGGTAVFHARWEISGVRYDSRDYGNPSAPIAPDGTACFQGGVGVDVDVGAFGLTELTVAATYDSGREPSGSATNLKESYDSPTEILSVTADFVYDPRQSLWIRSLFTPANY